MASIAKEMGIATIVGQKSSGGASSIGIIITPVGTSIIMSTNNVLSTRIGDEYFSIENGIEVDYFMLDVTDEDLLISIINEVNAG
jgi:carboxyl-terminal processing protease